MAAYDRQWRPHAAPQRYDMPYPPGGRPGPEPNAAVEFEGRMGSGIYGPARYGLGPYHQRLRARRRPDEDLREDVEDALFYDTWVDAEAITVEVDDAIVTLSGELPSYEEIRFATDDAWDVDGVRGVRTKLSIRSR